MSKASLDTQPVAFRRKLRGWSQEELALRAGLPRSSLSAVESMRLTPSVTAALALARALECSVEELFGEGAGVGSTDLNWAWEPVFDSCRYWEAEVAGRRWLFPVEALPGSSWVHDGVCRQRVVHERHGWDATRTLVLAGCDPAAGLLSAEYAAATGFRLLAFSRGGSQALELLKRGVVHVAAMHRSTKERPSRNLETAQQYLGKGYRLLRYAEWQEGIVLPAADNTRSVSACARQVRQWAMREPGSAARECLDELLDKPRHSKRTLPSHLAVAEAVRGGWAEAGVCVQLCAADAGLRFLPVRTESLDLCFPLALEHDPRVQGLISLLRGRTYRQLVDELPGYDASNTGALLSV